MEFIFLYANESNWEENYERAKEVLQVPIKLICGKGVSSLKDAYVKVFNAAETDTFVMIEGDNYLLPEAKILLDYQTPVKFWTTNKYGITYEHGGIKVLNTQSGKDQLRINSNIYENFEISVNLNLPSDYSVLSEHRFDFSERNEWITIARELIKLYVWGHYSYIQRWVQHERPRQIFTDCVEIINETSLTGLFETLLPSLGKIYDDRFAK